jgi:D-beta-D-heptose 7-phosphate kinase / D-beta-D-heptose 1-phosphate adenosyltransferase
MSGTPRPIVVIGDALLDRDVAGEVHRISPDAPVPVFDMGEGQDRPGGAALAATLAASGGQPVILVTAIGSDEAGDRLRELLDQAGVALRELPYQGETPQKIRLRADGQVLLRMDRGEPAHPGEPDEATAAALDSAVAVLVSDYGRGVGDLSGLRRQLAALAANRPVVWDPHPRGEAPVPGVRLVTPNESELRTAPQDGNSHRLAALAAGAAQARRSWRAGAVAVTLGADGALLAQGGATPLVVPPPVRASGDACGAGDRFAASATVALAAGALVSEAVQVAVGDAAHFVAGGAARAYSCPEAAQEQLVQAADAEPAGIGLAMALAAVARTRSRGGVVVATGGCFDLLHPGHVATLQAARQLGDCLVVCLNSDDSVRRLKGPDRPLVTQDDRARLVAALSCVDAVAIFDEATPVELLSQLRPDVWVKGGDYYLDDPDSQPVLPEAQLIRGWGGQSVVVPYLDGHSTTSLIQAARKQVGGNR